MNSDPKSSPANANPGCGAAGVSAPKPSHYAQDGLLERAFKHLLTRMGAWCSNRTVERSQAAVNYLKIGHWMRAHGFAFERLTRNRDEAWAVVASQIRDRRVLYLEFGVAEGETMSYWSRELKHPEAILHGFDSFEGLPEDGGPWVKGQFSTGGKIPEIADSRVRFFKGWFDQVLPSYIVPEHDVLVVNMDADLYSSTIYVLRHLRPQIKPGTFIYFDDFFCLDQEPEAFDEFLKESGLKFKGVSSEKGLVRPFFQCV
jgi:hypothetical protein